MSGREGHRCQHRVFEWLASGAMVTVGLTALIAPAGIPISAFQYISLIMSPIMLGLVLTIVGCLRLGALWLNGTWQHSAKVRIGGAFIGGFMWFQLFAALALASHAHDFTPLGITWYLWLVAGEAITCFRAATDDRGH